MQKLLMHISKLGNLKTLKPLTFENQKHTLCATDNYAFALMMFSKVDKQKHPQGNFHCSLKDDGILYVDEKWENALFEMFSNQKAYLYYLQKNNAVYNPAVPQFEFYEEQHIIKMVEIDNVYAELLKQIQLNNLKVNYYKKSKL